MKEIITMKRLIRASAELYSARNNYYPVTQITEYTFPGTVAYNLTDTKEKLDAMEKSSLRQYKLYPKKEVLILSQATADNILEELSEEYRTDVTADNIAEMLSRDNVCGTLAERDGTLVMLPGLYTLK